MCFSQFSAVKVLHLKPCYSEMFSQPVMKIHLLHLKGSGTALTPKVYEVIQAVRRNHISVLLASCYFCLDIMLRDVLAVELK